MNMVYLLSDPRTDAPRYISVAKFGKKPTAETRRKMSESQKLVHARRRNKPI